MRRTFGMRYDADRLATRLVGYTERTKLTKIFLRLVGKAKNMEELDRLIAKAAAELSKNGNERYAYGLMMLKEALKKNLEAGRRV